MNITFQVKVFANEIQGANNVGFWFKEMAKYNLLFDSLVKVGIRCRTINVWTPR